MNQTNQINQMDQIDQMNQMKNDSRGKLVCVLGAAGGVGASTVAANLAISLQRLHSTQSVLVVDTTLSGGDLSLMFGLALGAGFRPLPTDPQQVDEALLMNAQAKHRSGVHLLSLGHNSPLRPVAEPVVLVRTLELMARWHDWIVLDCGCMTERVTQAVVPHMSTVLIVATLALPPAQRMKQWVEWLINTGVPSGKIVAVMNRCREDEAEYQRQLKPLLPCRVGAYLPDSPELAREALINGAPLAEGDARAALACCYGELAVSLGGQSVGDSDRKPQGWFQSLQARLTGERHAA
jgi:pilus assembly protein CpaE